MRDSIIKACVITGGAVAGLLALSSCVQLAHNSFDDAQPAVAEASSLLSLASALHRNTSLLTNRTTSAALDRIDQRSLPLDETYQRNGSGRGVTVYVFDGGILPTHPELVGRVRLG